MGNRLVGSEIDEHAVVARAIGGDPLALEEVIDLLQDSVYRLALRMVSRPSDAEDATQEILIRVITRLASWRGEAKLLTWAYRIAVNYLLNLRRQSTQEAQRLSFQEFREDLLVGIADESYADPEALLLAEEVRLSCTQSMLQCLGRGERIAFVLGEIFQVSSSDAAWILKISPGAYRKRLERARHRIRGFMSSTCGLVNPDAFCRCARRVPQAVAVGRVDPHQRTFTTHPTTPSGRDVAAAAAQLERLHSTAAVLRAHPDYAAPKRKAEAITALIKSGRFSLLR
jgi:RNA polymerase sigma factor (sigma-70 family)